MEQFSSLQERYQYLIGESSSTADTIGKSHINWSIKDILNRHPFCFARKTTDLTLTSGTSDLPTDINIKWGVEDARVTGSSQNDDYVFTQIPIENRDYYGSSDYVYWITWDATNEVFVFNTHTQTGTVTIYYNHLPSNLSATTDYCIIPDAEAVVYLAASKNWVGDERNVELQQSYKQEAEERIKSLISSDLAFGPSYREGNIVDLNSNLRGSTDTLELERP